MPQPHHRPHALQHSGDLALDNPSARPRARNRTSKSKRGNCFTEAVTDGVAGAQARLAYSCRWKACKGCCRSTSSCCIPHKACKRRTAYIIIGRKLVERFFCTDPFELCVERPSVHLHLIKHLGLLVGTSAGGCILTEAHHAQSVLGGSDPVRAVYPVADDAGGRGYLPHPPANPSAASITC